MIISGIDEAGRGPVIGPMIIAISVIKKNKLDELIKLGVKDSKKLTRDEREEIFPKLIKILDYYTYKKVYPAEIDYAVLKENYNLNFLEMDVMIYLIKEVLNKLNVTEFYIDVPTTNIKKFLDYLYSRINKKVKIIAEHKADEKYVIVSSASIIAKVIRDREIENIKKKYKVDFGSGYPSDPRTRDFLKNIDKKEFEGIIRKSWETYKSSFKEKQKKLLDFKNEKEL